jgi:hypothetical protein
MGGTAPAGEMPVLKAAADGSLSTYDVSGYDDLPFASQGPCGV